MTVRISETKHHDANFKCTYFFLIFMICINICTHVEFIKDSLSCALLTGMMMVRYARVCLLVVAVIHILSRYKFIWFKFPLFSATRRFKSVQWLCRRVSSEQSNDDGFFISDLRQFPVTQCAAAASWQDLRLGDRSGGVPRSRSFGLSADRNLFACYNLYGWRTRERSTILSNAASTRRRNQLWYSNRASNYKVQIN